MLARARGVDPGGNLVGIGLLPDLLRFESGPDGTIELGAALTLEWLAGPDGGDQVPPLLRAAAIATANPGIRSVATLGGNIADAGAASDLVAALIALGARVRIVRHDDPVLRVFIDAGAAQCGFCIPAMVLVARSVIAREPSIDADGIRRALAGNLCRCGTYARVLAAVGAAAETARG